MTGVLDLDSLVLAVAEWRREGATIVLACGCFDPLHVGHVQHLQAAKRLGNVLLVSVTADEHVRAAKGPTRPRSPAAHRAEVVAALACVDAVVISEGPTAVPVLTAIRPQVFVKGVEYHAHKTPQILAEEAAIAAYGGRVEFVTGRVVCSSTAILAGV